jgi:hypothetical protein
VRTIATIVVGFFLASPLSALDEPYGGIRLLDGYRFERSHTFDTINGVITKTGGLRIEFESGINEGYAVEAKNKTKYIWYREQTINGHKVMFALAKRGVTPWKPEVTRNPTPSNVLMVTFPGRIVPDQAANFYAEVANEQEIADMLLMVLTFDPDK